MTRLANANHTTYSFTDANGRATGFAIDLSRWLTVEEPWQRWLRVPSTIRTGRWSARYTADEVRGRNVIGTIVPETDSEGRDLRAMTRDITLQPERQANLHKDAVRLRQVRTLLEKAGQECRTVMEDLTPALLYELGLVPALHDLAERLQATHGARISVAYDGREKPLSCPLRGLLFDSVRELIMNALKYAGPCTIGVAVNGCGDTLTIRVTDDGKGFDPAADARRHHPGGFGLFNIRQRLEGLGGRLDVASAPGKGTTATIRVPVG